MLVAGLKNYLLARKVKEFVSLLAASAIAIVVGGALGVGIYALLRTFGFIESVFRFTFVYVLAFAAVVAGIVIHQRKTRSPLASTHGGRGRQSLAEGMAHVGVGCLFAIPSYVAFTAEEVINLMSRRFHENVLKNAGMALTLIRTQVPYSFVCSNMPAVLEFDVREALCALRDLELASWSASREEFSVALTQEGERFVETTLAEALGQAPPE